MLEAFLFENSLKLLELSKGVLMLLRIPLGSRHHTLQVLDGLIHHEHLALEAWHRVAVPGDG